ncbi:MAG: ribosomal RNA small subunit methyltransferase A, partial [Bacteroidales bacterium]
MQYVRAKKHLGQHFLTDSSIAQNIVQSLECSNTKCVLELGPGTGVLTQFLLQRTDIDLHAIEVDYESVHYLQQKFPQLNSQLILGDFLQMKLSEHFSKAFCVIGNFPYNISSQIFFKILEYKNLVPEVVGML